LGLGLGLALGMSSGCGGGGWWLPALDDILGELAAEEAIIEVANLLMVVGSPTTAGRSNIQSFNGVKIFSEVSAPAGRPFCSHLFTFAWATLVVAPPGGGLDN